MIKAYCIEQVLFSMLSLLNTNSMDVFTESLVSKSVVVNRKNSGAGLS